MRIGNGAHTQLQLDVYGAVCSAAREFANATGTLASDEARLLRGFGQSVCRQWQQPDHGIWEIRGEPRQYTFSKVMCWTALDALVDLAEHGLLKLPPGARDARAALRRADRDAGLQPRAWQLRRRSRRHDVDASLC